jgi:hypothetical protein
MAQSEVQRREMVRVDDIMEISHRVITDSKKERLSGDILGRTRQGGMESVATILQSAGRTVDPDSPTWRAIGLLDKKLDLVISLPQTDNRSDEVEFVRCGVNVSGSGIRFPSQQNYEKGDHLWISMIFPSSPVLRVEAVALVGRAQKSGKFLERLHGSVVDISSKFIAINASDKEEILRYTFQRQRELLRAKRGD